MPQKALDGSHPAARIEQLRGTSMPEAVGEHLHPLAPEKVQELVSGAFANNGFILVADTELNDRFNYKSSDASASANRPKLVVQYTLPQGSLPSNKPPLAQMGAKALFAPAPQGDLLTYTSQPDGTSGVDTFLQSTSPATNFGTDGGLRVGESNDATNRYTRSLIKFDLSSIPANATITSATLSLWTSADFSDNDRTIRVYRLKTAFDESTATWNEASSGVSWQTAGASGANDREATDIGAVMILANEPLNTEKQITLAPNKVQEWVSGTFANNGFIIVADTELNDRFNYKSSDAGASAQRPKLVVQYTVNGPTPTPTLTPAPTTPPAPFML